MNTGHKFDPTVGARFEAFSAELPGSDCRCDNGVTSNARGRLLHVATLLDERRGSITALSGEKEVGYSVVVKTTEQAPRTDPMIADPENSDQMIIQRVLSGNRDAFKTLISRYSDPLYRHALCMTGSPDVAEDILQLSFIKAYQHLAEVRGRFDAWVFRIVANGCKDWLKNIRRSHPVSYTHLTLPTICSV